MEVSLPAALPYMPGIISANLIGHQCIDDTRKNNNRDFDQLTSNSKLRLELRPPQTHMSRPKAEATY